MYRLETLHLVQFYLSGAETLQFGASSGIVAPNGSGKSAILDAIQIGLLGADGNAVELNAQSGGSRDGRSVRRYCLGYYRDEDFVRESAATYITLVFRDSAGSKPPVSCGVALGATIHEPKLHVYGRYIAPGVELTLQDHLEIKDGEAIPADWATFRHALIRQAKAAGHVAEVDFSAATRYVESLLFRLRPASARGVNRVAFTKAFKNALNLKDIPDTSAFVRDRIAEERPLNLDRFREQLDSFRTLRQQIADVIDRMSRAEAVRATCARAAHARMRAASYAALAAEYRRDVQQEALSAADEAAEAAARTAAQVQRRADAARECEASADRELRALLEETRTRGGTNATDLDGERRSVLGPVKSDMARTLRRIVSSLQQAARIDPASSAWTSILTPWVVLLDRIERSRAGDDLDLDTNAVLGRLRASSTELPGQLSDVARRCREAKENVERLTRDLDLNRSSLQRAERGKAELRDEVRNLQQALEREGIHATPVCDLVEVADPDWAPAIEAYLRRNVQALVVEPGREDDAVALYQRLPEGSKVFGAKIVQPGRARAALDASDALGCLIRGRHADAVEFLRARLGRLKQLDQAVVRGPDGLTRRGMLIQNGSIERLWLPPVHELLLGSHDTRTRRDRLARERIALEQALGEARKVARQTAELQAALGPLAGLEGVIEDMDAWLVAHADHERRLAVLAANRRTQLDPDLIALQEAITASNERLEQARAERSAADKALGAALGARDRAAEEVKRLEGACDSAAANAVTASLAPFVDAGWMDEKRIELDARGDALSALVTLCENRATREVRDHITLESQVRTEVGAYAVNYGVSLDFEPSEIDRALAMLDADLQRLRDSELATYEAQAQEAYATAVRTFRSRIAAQLRTHFDDLFHQVRLLNGVLERSPPFTNNERYYFKVAVDPVHKALYDFINAVADQKHDDMLESHVETPEAFRQLMEDAAGVSRSVLEDYRRFFVFDVEVRDNGRKVSTLRKRMESGSGGEHRAPLFVVAGAALAAGYGKSRGDAGGLSLILLDELGDKIDSNNTRAIFDYLHSLGLQPIVAAPTHALSSIGPCITDYTELFRAEDVLVMHHVDVRAGGTRLLESDSYVRHPELVALEAAAVRAETAGLA